MKIFGVSFAHKPLRGPKTKTVSNP